MNLCTFFEASKQEESREESLFSQTTSLLLERPFLEKTALSNSSQPPPPRKGGSTKNGKIRAFGIKKPGLSANKEPEGDCSTAFVCVKCQRCHGKSCETSTVCLKRRVTAELLLLLLLRNFCYSSLWLEFCSLPLDDDDDVTFTPSTTNLVPSIHHHRLSFFHSLPGSCESTVGLN